MVTPKRITFLQDNKLNLTAANFAQQTARVNLPRNWPIEDIYIGVQVTIGAAANITPICWGILNLLRRVTLEVTEPAGPRTVVNLTGPGLLQHLSNEGLSLDRCTLATLGAHQRGFLSGTGVYRIWYRIPFAHPQITGMLRARSLLPVHLHPQDPTLTLEFGAAAELFSGVADPFTAANVEVHLVQREVSKAFHEAMVKETGGNAFNWFLKQDIMETIFPLTASLTNAEQRFDIPMPGQYSGMTIYMEKGNATLTPDDISASTTVGAETQWRIEAGGIPILPWRMKALQAMNDQSRAVQPPTNFNLNVLTAASPKLVTSGTANVNATAIETVGANFGGPGAVGLAVQAPASVFHDFLSDGLTDADEFGSLLDANGPSASGLKLQIVGNVTTPANQPSNFKIVGRRYYDNLSRWQAIARMAA